MLQELKIQQLELPDHLTQFLGPVQLENRQDGTGYQLSLSRANIFPPTTKANCSYILFVLATGQVKHAQQHICFATS